MITVFIIGILITQVISAPTSEDAKATIVEYDNTNDGKGNYEFSFLTSNGIERREMGKLVNIGEPDEHIEVQGLVSYLDPDGKLVTIRYTSGKEGYQILPQSPPIMQVSYGLSANVVATLLGK